jgi:hypothetical protein
VRQGISLVNGHVRAAGGETGEDTDQIYPVLRNSWLIQRASARSTIITYFPDLDACWYSYERVLADYLGLVVADEESRAARVDMIRRYVDADFSQSYVERGVADTCAPLSTLPANVQRRFQELKDAIGWDALTFPTDNPRFRNVYAALGEALLIGKERIITTIVDTPARGFHHGVGFG